MAKYNVWCGINNSWTGDSQATNGASSAPAQLDWQTAKAIYDRLIACYLSYKYDICEMNADGSCGVSQMTDPTIVTACGSSCSKSSCGRSCGTTVYNVWYLTANRWTNSNKAQDGVGTIYQLTWQEAKDLCDMLNGSACSFEVRELLSDGSCGAVQMTDPSRGCQAAYPVPKASCKPSIVVPNDDVVCQTCQHKCSSNEHACWWCGNSL